MSAPTDPHTLHCRATDEDREAERRPDPGPTESSREPQAEPEPESPATLSAVFEVVSVEPTFWRGSDRLMVSLVPRRTNRFKADDRLLNHFAPFGTLKIQVDHPDGPALMRPGNRFRLDLTPVPYSPILDDE